MTDRAEAPEKIVVYEVHCKPKTGWKYYSCHETLQEAIDVARVGYNNGIIPAWRVVKYMTSAEVVFTRAKAG